MAFFDNKNRLLEKYLGWIAIPNIAVLLVTLQGLGFLMVMSDPIWINRLCLIPELVLQGEYWRLITFLALPLSTSPLWIIFTLWFIYFVLGTIESEWGSFKTTLYVLVSLIVTICFSFIFNYPITQVSDFESTLFLAAATLFPETEILFSFVIPVKMKWLAILSGLFVGYRFLEVGLIGKIYLFAIYSNYLIFFGPQLINLIKQKARRKSFQRKFK